MRVAFRTFGCKLNLYESSGMAQAAAKAGFLSRNEEGAPEIVVVNTCSVTMRADQEARQYIRRVHRRYPEARIVVTGCYAQRAPEELSVLPGVVMVAGHREKDRMAEILQELPPPGRPARVLVGSLAGKRMTALRALGVENRTRALLRVQDGCNSACTYCVIPQTRGRSQSLPFEEALAEGARLLAAGYREMVLTGTHLGHYGLDLRPKRRLSELVQALLDLEVGHAYRVRVSSVEPQEIDDRLVAMMAASDRLASHLHLPLQSGSDDLLRAMRRSYRTAAYRERVREIAARVPGLALGADLIVGFPGETEADMRRTLTFLAELPFTHLHAFPYSPRPGTLAATWKFRPPGDVTHRRLRAAQSLVAAKNRLFGGKLVGGRLRVLVERERDDGTAEGFSGNYMRVRFPAPAGQVGRFVLVTVTGFHEDHLQGRVVATVP